MKKIIGMILMAAAAVCSCPVQDSRRAAATP